MSFPRDITLIAGPTAVGKSAYALDLARTQNGVIINADSVQFYDALPILTAQPSANDRAAAPHVLYGVIAPDHPSSVQDWLTRAALEVHQAWDAGLTPIVVGGTGLYLNALVDGLSPLPDVPDNIRAATRAQQKELGNPAFHTYLTTIDPVMGRRLRPTDTQRLIRAAEVMIATGRSLADWQAAPRETPFKDTRIHKILIDAPRDVLRHRAEQRLKIMVENGVTDEVAAFRNQYPHLAVKALGYQAFVDYLDHKLTLGQAVQAAFIQTAQYIKRQQTWFRHQMTFDETIGT